jgi:hypothetical protein
LTLRFNLPSILSRFLIRINRLVSDANGEIPMPRTVTHRLLSLLLAIGIATSVFAQTGQWVDLGSTRVNGKNDHDTIQVRNQGTFRAIQIRVRGNAGVHFNLVVLRYGNGQREQIKVRDVIQGGSSSRVIDLPGVRRVIDKIDFLYDKANWGNRNHRRPPLSAPAP